MRARGFIVLTTARSKDDGHRGREQGKIQLSGAELFLLAVAEVSVGSVGMETGSLLPITKQVEIKTESLRKVWSA